MCAAEPSRARWLAAVLAAAVAAGACEDQQTVASRYLKRLYVPAESGGVVQITAEESPELAGTQLIIYPRALAADTIITVEVGTTAIARHPAGPVVWFGPPGTVFSSPSRLTVPAHPDGAGRSQVLEAREEDGQRWSMPAGRPPGAVRAAISRLAAFQVGWQQTFTPCIAIALSEARPPVVQFTGIPATPARRPTMNTRTALASALFASCSVLACQQPPDEKAVEQQSAEARGFPAPAGGAACLERCQIDARQSFERCLDTSRDRGPCISRFTDQIGSCHGTCDVRCQPPAPPPPAVPPPDPKCIRPCEQRQKDARDRCAADGGDDSTCRTRGEEAFRACFAECSRQGFPVPPPPIPPPAIPPPPIPPPAIPPPPIPPPAIPPAPAPPPPSACEQACRDDADKQTASCIQAGGDRAGCENRAAEAERACIGRCGTAPPPPPGFPMPPPPPPPPPRN